MAESKSRNVMIMRDEEFAKLVNATTGFHLLKYVQRLVTYEESNRAILMRGGQYTASPIMTDGTNSLCDTTMSSSLMLIGNLSTTQHTHQQPQVV